jgi:hypothetical protein
MINQKRNTYQKTDQGMKYLLKFILVALVSTNANAQPWIQIGQDIDGEAAYDYSGYSVSLSADGNTVAIGGYI